MSSSVVTVNPQEPQKTVVILMNNGNSNIPITPQTVQNLLVTPENRLPSNVKILSSEDSRSAARPHQEASSIRVVRIGGADDDEDVTDLPKINLTVHSVQHQACKDSSPITLQETISEAPQAVPEPVDPTPPPISMEELLADISMDHCYSAVPPPSMIRAQQQHGTYTHSTQPMAPELPEDFMASDEDDEDSSKKEEEKPSIDISPKPESDLQTEAKSYLQIDSMNNDLRNGLSIQNQKKIGRRASEDSKKRAFSLSQDHPLCKSKPPTKHIAQSSKEKITTAKVSRRDSRKSSSVEQDIFSPMQDGKKHFEKERKLQVKIESPKQMAKRKPKVEVKEESVKEEKIVSKNIELRKKPVPQSKEEIEKKKRGKKEEPTLTEDEESSEDSDDSEDDDDEDGEDDDPEKLWCICRKPHNNRFMICCDKCEDWFHGKCVGVSQATGRKMEETGEQWFCPNCRKDDKQRDKDENEQDQRRRREKKGDSSGADPPSKKDDSGGSTRRGRKNTEQPHNNSDQGGE